MTRVFQVISIAAVLCTGGCAAQKSWVYSPNPFRDTAPMGNKKAVVPPFDDARPNLNSNKLMLYAIPLFPFGWQDLSVPEGAQAHITSGLWINYKPTEDFAKALATELQNARVFRESYFDFQRGDADVVISGKIINTNYSGKILSYGLSVYGPMFWLFGLPAATFSNELAVELRLLDAKTNRELFSRTYTATPYSKTNWIYVLDSDFNYAGMLKEVYQQFLRDLAAQGAAVAVLPGPAHVDASAGLNRSNHP